MDKQCENCKYHKSEKYHDMMWCRDCNSNKNHFKAKKYYCLQPDCGCFAIEFNNECLSKETCEHKTE